LPLHLRLLQNLFSKSSHPKKKDLIKLEKELQDNPKMGTRLGKNVYKIRLKISSKGIQ